MRKVNYNRCVNAFQINEDTATIERIRSWIRKARKFRANYVDIKQHEIRNFGVRR